MSYAVLESFMGKLTWSETFADLETAKLVYEEWVRARNTPCINNMCVSIVDEPRWLKAKLDGMVDDTHTSKLSIEDIIEKHILPVQHKAKQASKQASLKSKKKPRKNRRTKHKVASPRQSSY